MYYIILGFVVCCVSALSQDVIVYSNVGQIVGTRTEQFVKFVGVPYGAVDVKNPFGASTPHPHFATILHAKMDPPLCPQININGVLDGTIQCLNLNIYTPTNATQASVLPVMVFIHGGGFVEGTGNLGTYSPKFIVKKNVILVTVNYRLGAYGFICLPDIGYSNQGIKDVVLALKWVKDNINSFGGDNNNILLFGHSAGSAIVDLILQYNENNVFNKVILQSIQAVSPMVGGVNVQKDFVFKLAKNLHIDLKNKSIKDVMAEISSLDPKTVTNETKSVLEFRPCVDNVTITDMPRKENMKNMKIMTGSTTREILFMYYRDKTDAVDKLKRFLNIGFSNLSAEAIDTVKNFYLHGNDDDIVVFGTDFGFQYPIDRSIRFYTQNHATVYRYLFSYDGGRNFIKIRDSIADIGASHGDELGYLFDMEILSDNVTGEDQHVIDAMTTIWTNFAKHGNPSPLRQDILPTSWPNVDKDSNIYLNIDAGLSLEKGPFEETVAFWDKFYEMYGTHAKGFNFGEKYLKNVANVNSMTHVLLIVIMLLVARL